jgi:hypothetical protein
MAEPKTKKTTASVSDFIAGVENPVRRRDAKTVGAMMARLTGARAAMWGPTIVGYGSWDQVTADGKSNPWPVAAFSPRGPALVVYIMTGFPGREALLAKLGPHSIGKSCLYLKRLDDVHLPTLEKLILGSMESVGASRGTSRGATRPRTATAKKRSRAARS